MTPQDLAFAWHRVRLLGKGLTVFYNTAASVPTQVPGRLLGLMQLWGLASHVCVR